MASHTADAESFQFSLREMLVFMVAASIYFSQVAMLPDHLNVYNFTTQTALIATLAWLALAWFYSHWRLRKAIVAHSVATAFGLLIGLFDSYHIEELFEYLAAGMYFSNLCSFPAAVLMLLLRPFETPRCVVTKRQRPDPPRSLRTFQPY